MLPLLALVQNVFGTYVDSLKKDLTRRGFEVIVLIAVVPWFNLLLLLGLFILGRLQLPTDIWFYVFWLGVTSFYTIQFTFFILGLKHASFLTANVFPNLSFFVTTLYAVLLLRESLGPAAIYSLILAVLGSLLFFEWNPETRESLRQNKGLLYVLISVVLSPLTGIFYKSASLHTFSYHQFLTGRLTMDAAYYSLFLLLLYAFWYRRDPGPEIRSFLIDRTGIMFIVLVALNSLLGSWLIFKLPISVIALLGTISIPAGYVIGKWKYGEKIKPRYLLGGALIIAAVLLVSIKV